MNSWSFTEFYLFTIFIVILIAKSWILDDFNREFVNGWNSDSDFFILLLYCHVTVLNWVCLLYDYYPLIWASFEPLSSGFVFVNICSLSLFVVFAGRLDRSSSLLYMTQYCLSCLHNWSDHSFLQGVTKKWLVLVLRLYQI